MANHTAFLNGTDSLPASPMLAAGAFALLDAKMHGSDRSPNSRQLKLATHLEETKSRLRMGETEHEYTLKRGMQDAQHQHERIMQSEKLGGDAAGRAHSFSMAQLASSDAREDREHAWRMQGASRATLEGTFAERSAHEATMQHMAGQQNFNVEKMKTDSSERIARGQQKIDTINVKGQLRAMRDNVNFERDQANMDREPEHLTSLKGG